ncbi:hypothetical protein [Cryobacterium soli]|uniref:hypothetical protein n=1 Tax=Cryobacterium soli TaxID=2220095 RepID=UPI000E76344A|nr:hypothetical protein [Cryobacterium soli]
MNYEQVGALLGRVKLGDNREIDDKGLMIEDWFQTIGHLPFDECLAAVVLHRQERPGVWLEPGHIIAGVRVLRAKSERVERIAAQMKRQALPAPRINLDREKFELETQAAIEATRAAKAARG